MRQESRPGGNSEAAPEKTHHHGHADLVYCHHNAIPDQLRRRRAASWRCAPLDCGCGPDPLGCTCSSPPLSEHMVDAGRDAALHILKTGRVPVLEIEVLRALYRRGGADRELAERLHRLSGQVVA
jgi:hypothetical protein